MGDLGKGYKLVFLGDQGVGKTSIITCFMYGKFDTSYQVRPSALIDSNNASYAMFFFVLLVMMHHHRLDNNCALIRCF